MAAAHLVALVAASFIASHHGYGDHSRRCDVARMQSMQVAVCIGGSCEQRCAAGFDPKAAFEAMGAEVVEINCMNMCKRGPAVRLVSDGEVQRVNARMGELEQKRNAFQAVSPAKAEAIWGVAQGIADGSLRDAHGEFETAGRGPLPPSAQ